MKRANKILALCPTTIKGMVLILRVVHLGGYEAKGLTNINMDASESKAKGLILIKGQLEG